jgi:hypothetical protein
MWNFFNCYLSGRHDYGMWCEPGAMFLRCVHCGKRSCGWTVASKVAPVATVHSPISAKAPTRVIPFSRPAADHVMLTLPVRRDHNTQPCPFPASPKKI